MKILKATADNFQSYRYLEFDFTSCGLTCIFGSTGAGKSTLMDLVPWCLYGTTGKGSAADDVKSWNSEKPATANVMVGTPSGVISVHRARGRGKNDLYWVEYGKSSDCRLPGEPTRGKDLKDTQRLLEDRLGVSADLFMMSAYMSQFSEADSFFIASAKDRRSVLEKIADQEFAIKLGERTSEAKKTAKKDKDIQDLEISKLSGKLESTEQSLTKTVASARDWDLKQEQRIQVAEDKCFNYAKETSKASSDWDTASWAKLDSMYAQIEDYPEIQPSSYFDDEIAKLKVEPRCPNCNALRNSHSEAIAKLREQKFKNQELENALDRLRKEYRDLRSTENPHQLTDNPYEIQLRDLKAAINPFAPNVESYKSEVSELKTALNSKLEQLKLLQERINGLSWLYDKSLELRGLMMERVVKQVEENTNYYLEKFFDGALRVILECAGSDKIEVIIRNDGNIAPFKQLSGGERCQLKLAFTLSIMKAAQNKAGVALNCIMLDEPLTGLPEDLKVKAFGLFDELTKDFPSVLVIDHSVAFQQMFVNSFIVDKVNGTSVLSNSA